MSDGGSLPYLLSINRRDEHELVSGLIPNCTNFR
jgi:hypothetical protein